MIGDIVDAVGDRPVPLAATETADHVVVRLTPAGRRLLGEIEGRPLRETLQRPALLAALDAAYHHDEPRVVHLAEPDAAVACVPVRGGVLLLVASGDRASADEMTGTDVRSRNAALQRLAGRLSAAATPAAVAHHVGTTAAALLGADAAAVYARSDADTLDVLHAGGWSAEVLARFTRLELHRGRPLSDAVLDRTPVWLEDPEQWHSRYPEMAPIGTAEGYRATACLPLCVEDRDLGAVVFSFLTSRRFSEEEREYLEAVAALCAQSLDRVRLLVAERAARAAAERQLDRMTFLANAGRLMESPLSVDQRLQQLAGLAVPDVADWCAVHLIRDDRVEQVAVAHADPDKVAFVARLQERYPPNPAARGGAVEVSRTGEPAFFPEIPDELLVRAAVDDEHLALIRSIGMHSAVVVPLLVRGRSLGALTLVQAESGQRFDDVDVAFARQLAGVAAVALDNARLYEQQHWIAETLQDALLPAVLPAVRGLGAAARYRPQTDVGAGIHVGGDLYDVVADAATGRCTVVVADVCGKGPVAAARTALIRYTVRAEVAHGYGPAEVLRRLNRSMLRDIGDAPARFATVALGRLTVDADGASLTLANAGHPAPLVRRGAHLERLSAPGTLLGVYPDIELTETTVRLDRGDIMVLYTDGVTEAHGVNGYYGEQRLRAVVGSSAATSAEVVADDLLADVVAFQQGRLRDDVAVLVLQVTL